MHTGRINTYNQNIAPQGTALPQANIPGGYHLDAYTARHLGNVSNALQDLAGLELRMKESRRADALNMARTSYLNDIIREEKWMAWFLRLLALLYLLWGAANWAAS